MHGLLDKGRGEEGVEGWMDACMDGCMDGWKGKWDRGETSMANLKVK